VAPRAPLLIVVTGAPGSGKTTVARPLAAQLGLPLFTKDDVKEALWEHFGAGDRELFLAYGRASYPLLLGLVGAALAAGSSAMVEANFRPQQAAADFERLLASRPCRVVQVLCVADRQACLERYRERDRLRRRHAMHLVGGAETEAGLERELRDGVWDVPIPLPGLVIRLDTNVPVDVEMLATEIAQTE
jgi:predicted kinase